MPEQRTQSSHHEHEHEHGRGHGHSHTHAQGHDAWAGRDYLSRPGVKETAIISAETVIYALSSAGVTQEQMQEMDFLEIGCGPGVVTTHLLPHFHSIHAIDTSPSMLLAFSNTHQPSLSQAHSHALTYSLHTLSSESVETFASGTPQLSPTPDDEGRMIIPPKAKFNLAIANLVLHHVDDLDGFLDGVVGVLKDGGWVVFTEFGRDEGEVDRVFNDVKKVTEQGSVNAPEHYHPAFKPAEVSELLIKHGFVDVHTEYRGTLPVFGEDKYQPPCLIIRAKKSMI